MHCYFAPVGEQSIAISLSVCLCVYYYYYYYYYKCQDLSDAITTVAGALYKVYTNKNVTRLLTCLPVREHISKNRCTDPHEILYAYPLWPWLGPPMAALRYVMYFQFLWMTSRMAVVDHMAMRERLNL